MFPLESVLLPDQDLPLRIFEPRYGALVRHCLGSGEPFGVVLIARGREVGGDDSRCDVGVLAAITDHADQGAGRYAMLCRTGERIRVHEWLPDDPYPRAVVQVWPDEPGEPVTDAAVHEIEDQVMALFQRIAEARGVESPDRDAVLDYGTDDPARRLFVLASRIPIGTADRYSILSAPSAAGRLAALREAVVTVTEMVEFQLSE
jgi:Lon protease-like protein